MNNRGQGQRKHDCKIILQRRPSGWYNWIITGSYGGALLACGRKKGKEAAKLAARAEAIKIRPI